jgi:two-component system response regulator YesN
MRSRILVVDDNEMYLAGVKELLDRAGYDTFVASSFEDGKVALHDRMPHLLILDVRLGAFNGLQLISTGRVGIPAIVVTGFDDPVLRADASEFGASYLVKPVPPAALLELIEEKLKSACAAETTLLVAEGSSATAPAAKHGGLAGGTPRTDGK